LPLQKLEMLNRALMGTWNERRLRFCARASYASSTAGAISRGNKHQRQQIQLMQIHEQDWGTLPDGGTARLFTFTNRNGMVVKVTTYGGIITELLVPDRSGDAGNVVLGFDQLDAYLKVHPYFGAITGRVANRIAKGRFTLDGKEYVLAVNNGPNHLHGGIKGFDKVLWEAAPVQQSEAGVELSYFSEDGEEGYPGNLSVKVTYSLTEENELRIDYAATTDQTTPVNLTNHSYFNLAGAGDILGHEMFIAADRYTPVNDELIPTGEIAPVPGTPLDFTRPEKIGSRIHELRTNPPGYDHNFVLNSGGGTFALAARVHEPSTGRVMEVFTTEPGVQLYTGNFLDGTLTGVGGRVYARHSGFCLETQHFPDAVNQPDFPSILLRPGETYRTKTSFRFSTR
jgi:aldose 1-epimerase